MTKVILWRFVFNGFSASLAVEPELQGHGIGKVLIVFFIRNNYSPWFESIGMAENPLGCLAATFSNHLAWVSRLAGLAALLSFGHYGSMLAQENKEI